MELMYAVIEAVVISFFMGAILGGIVVFHLARKAPERAEEFHHSADLQPAKIKVKSR